MEAENQIVANLLNWHENNAREFQWREFKTPYSTFIAEFLLQKTHSSKVEPVYSEMLRRYPDLEALQSADQNELAEMLRPLGLHNKRSKALVKIANSLDEIPADEDELQELPYVGPYTANATLSFGFDIPSPIVDGNVLRIYNRYFGRSFTAESGEAWDFASELLPREDHQRFNLSLLDLGAGVCKAENPDCDSCPLSENCAYFAAEVDNTGRT